MSILARSHAMSPEELAVEIRDVAKAAPKADFGDSQSGFLKEAGRLAEPDLVDEGGERLAGASSKKTAERRRREMGAGGDAIEIDRLCEVIVDVGANPSDAII